VRSCHHQKKEGRRRGKKAGPVDWEGMGRGQGEKRKGSGEAVSGIVVLTPSEKNLSTRVTRRSFLGALRMLGAPSKTRKEKGKSKKEKRPELDRSTFLPREKKSYGLRMLITYYALFSRQSSGKKNKLAAAGP